MTHIPRMEITADEVNCLIHAYFQDSGFVHSAFVLRAEGHLEKSPCYGKHVPRGELIELLSKALLYSEVEAHWRGNALTKNCKASFSLLDKHVCSLDPAISPVTIIQPLPTLDIPSVTLNGTSEKRKATAPAVEDLSGPKEKRARTEEMDVDSVASVEHHLTESRASARDSSPPLVKEPSRKSQKEESKAIGMLKGHQSEVFVCAWNPKRRNILGTGSKDTIIHIWNVHDPTPEGTPPESEPPLTLAHLSKTESGDLTSLDWNDDGTLLASGSYDCLLRVCDASGQLYFSHDQHKKGPIFATRFSKNGQYLLTASLDGTVCVWDVPNKTLYEQHACHEEPCLDAEWITDEIFASCGADGKIQVMQLGSPKPIKAFTGHKDEINQIKCNASRTLLVSCSDDTTARIWDVNEHMLSSSTPKEQPSLAILAGHSKTVSSIAWCPIGSSGLGPDEHEMLATSSFDGTSRLWDSVTGDCLRAFSDHRDSIYTLRFSPDGRFFTTGGADGWMFVYDVKGREKRWSWHTTTGPPGIFEIDWQQIDDVNRLAFGMSSGLVGVVDVSRIPALQP
ncbi:WD40-repeat-containing domain protein [Irpex rosettiformis]|uniref:WD40-repeat-containing domain protein n=1 Tax=Irpex rosettiformis TaxID=378272 RepID=A0ACB8UJ81_9APHY|nr:WD40-repeat-containing domain protein [Irpex rosettiformis]